MTITKTFLLRFSDPPSPRLKSVKFKKPDEVMRASPSWLKGTVIGQEEQ